MGEGVVIRIGMFQVQTPLGPRLGLVTQTHYEAPGDLQVKKVKLQ